jgi:tetratricopeptide (TPR) repeat protein
MQQAVGSTVPSGEAAAWYRVQLAHLEFVRGDLDAAQAEYEAALEAFPGYVHGLAGLGRVAAARGDTEEAIARYSRAVERLPVLEYVIALGDIYHAAGRDDDAAKQYELVDVIAQLYRSNGVNTDLELAVFYADHDQRLDEAVRQARVEYERRSSVQAADALAWALNKAGQTGEAQRYSTEALRLGTRDPVFLYRAGKVALAAGETAQSYYHLSAAVALNPRFSALYADDAAEVLGLIDAGEVLVGEER